MAASLTSTLLCHDRRTVLPHPYRRRNRAGLRLYVCAGILLESGQAILGGVHRVRDQPAEHRPDPAKGRAGGCSYDCRCVAALVLLGLFAQERMLLLSVLSLYLCLMLYLMLTSVYYGYAAQFPASSR